MNPGAPLHVTTGPGPLGAGGGFFVDPERAQQCIDKLIDIALDMDKTLLTLQSELTFEPCAADPVSVNAAEQGAIMAERATLYVLAWREQVATTVLNLQTQLATYQEAEAGTLDRLR